MMCKFTNKKNSQYQVIIRKNIYRSLYDFSCLHNISKLINVELLCFFCNFIEICRAPGIKCLLTQVRERTQETDKKKWT